MRQAHGSDQALGGLARAMRGIKPSINVLALLPWQHLLRSWTNVHEQQDAAEFVTYLFGHSTPEAYHGRWESRMLVEDPDDSTDTMAIHESGLTSIPLVLEIAGPSLQHSIYAWHTQARVHALCSPPPPLLLLQLKRFRSTVMLATVKDRTHVMAQAGEIVRLHCFYNDVDTSTFLQQYRVVGTVFHVGTELKAGHYKAALSGAIRQRRQHAFYVTDDDKPLLRLKQATAEMHEGVYIVGLQRL